VNNHESVPFSCRLKDATSGNTQQLEARRGNSQHSEVKAFRLQEASRLWAIDRMTAERALEALASSGFLVQTREGAYLRSSE
jgi:Fic family protein